MDHSRILRLAEPSGAPGNCLSDVWRACFSGSLDFARSSAGRTIAVSSMSGQYSLANSKTQPEGVKSGRLAAQSPLRRISFVNSQSAAAVSFPVPACPSSPRAKAAIAVSQNGDLHGWKMPVFSRDGQTPPCLQQN
jgi:hypothetical protein